MNGNTERAQCAPSLVCIPQEMGKKGYVAIKGNVLNVVQCVSKDVLEYARIFSVIVGLEKEP